MLSALNRIVQEGGLYLDDTIVLDRLMQGRAMPGFEGKNYRSKEAAARPAIGPDPMYPPVLPGVWGSQRGSQRGCQRL